MKDGEVGMDSRLLAMELQLEVSSRRRTLYFHGESMRPFLVEGDQVVVEPVRWEDIRLGDVITYRYLDRFPTRRVMRKGEERLVLWCDNWPERSFEASREDLLGRAIARQRGAAWLTSRHMGWRLATIRARWRWELLHLRRVLRLLPWRVRWAVGRALRAIGLLPPLQKK